MRQRFLSILTCLALCLSLVPGAALAADTHTVTFSAGEGTGTKEPVTGISGEYTLPWITTTSFVAPEGTEFKGWEVDGVIYAENAVINVESDITATAIWVIPTSIQLQSINFYTSKATGYQLDQKITRYWKNGDSSEFTGTADDYNAKIEWSIRDGKDVATITLKGANTADTDNTNYGLTILAANTFDVDIIVEEDSVTDQISIYSCDVNISGSGKLTVVDPKTDAQNIYVDGNLALNGANIYAESLGKNAANIIFATGDLDIDNSTVEVKSGSDWTESEYPDYNYAPLRANGTMTIKNGSNVSVTCTDSATCHAVMSIGDLTIEDSTVTVTNNGTNRGISAEKNFYIKQTAGGTTNVTVNSNGIAIAARNGKLSISGGNVAAASTQNYAPLRADEIEISGGSVTANAEGTYGIHAEVGDIIISDDADVTASSETNAAIYAVKNINISDAASVTATSDSHTGMIAEKNIEISGTASIAASGKWGLWSKANTVSISGGTVEAVGSSYAIVSKPDLSNYAKPVVSAGSSATDAEIVSDVANTNYHGQKYVKIEPSYNITVNGANGIASASASLAPAGAEISLTATPNTGYQFKKWTSTNGNITFTDTEATTFTMPASDVEITAEFEAKSYNITYNLNSGTNAATNPATYTIESDTITLANPTRDGYTFSGWYDAPTGGNQVTEIPKGSTGGKTLYARWTEITYTVTYTDGVEGQEVFADQQYAGLTSGTATPTFNGTPSRSGYTFQGWTPAVSDTVDGDAVYTATWKKKSSKPDTPSTPSTPDTPDEPGKEEITVPISGDEETIHVDASTTGTTATIDGVDLSRLDTVIGDDVQTGTVTIDFSGLDTSEPITTVEIPADVVKEIAAAAGDPNNDAESLEIVLSDGTSIEFDAEALGEKAAQADGLDITISIEHHDNAEVTEAQKEAVGDRPAYDINVTSGGKHISNMGGEITVHAPYDLRPGEHPQGIVVWYVDDNGSRERCETSYDQQRKRVNWKTDHLSLYMIDYDESLLACDGLTDCPSANFTDLDTTQWYHEPVDYVLSNGLMNGITETEFAPNGTVTRAQVVTILHRLAGEPAVDYALTFADVTDGQWYTEAVRWAASEGIVTGHDEDTFAPNDPVIREQFAAILYRYEQHNGGGFQDAWAFRLDFPDVEDLSDWAYEAMSWCVMEGIIGGHDDGTLDPQGTSTRAQAAKMLMNFCETGAE